MSSRDLLNQKILIEEFLNKERHESSAFSFANIFTWRDFFDFRFEKIDENLCIFAEGPLGCFLYLPPLGRRISRETIDACFHIMNTKNDGNGISRIENVEEQMFPFFPKKEFSYFKKSDEYIYRREDIVALKGNPFKAKRALYNHFVKNYHYEYLPFEKNMQAQCETLYESWAKERAQNHDDEIYRQMLKENQSVHRLALSHDKDLGLVGRVVLVDKKIKAYSFGFKLNNDTFCILLEIADLNVKGLSVFIFRELCADREIQKYAFVNCMDDFGLDNIRTTKLSFRPSKLLPSYVVSRKMG